MDEAPNAVVGDTESRFQQPRDNAGRLAQNQETVREHAKKRQERGAFRQRHIMDVQEEGSATGATRRGYLPVYGSTAM